ncbi:MAG: hypothetical protein ABI479_08415 [Gallionella sp.]
MVRLLAASCLILTAVTGFLAPSAYAETPEEVLATIKNSASATPGFQGFSAARGETFYKNKHGGD